MSSLLSLVGTHPLFTVGNMVNLTLVVKGARKVATIDFPENSEHDRNVHMITNKIRRQNRLLVAHDVICCECSEMCGCVSLPFTLSSYQKKGNMIADLGFLYPFDKTLDEPRPQYMITWLVGDDVVYRESCGRKGITSAEINKAVLERLAEYNRLLESSHLVMKVTFMKVPDGMLVQR